MSDGRGKESIQFTKASSSRAMVLPLDNGKPGESYNLSGEYSISEKLKDEIMREGEDEDEEPVTKKEDTYQNRRFRRNYDPNAQDKSYKQIMQERELEREEVRIQQAIKEKEQEAQQEVQHESGATEEPPKRKRRQRWDVGAPEEIKPVDSDNVSQPAVKKSKWDDDAPTFKTPVPIINGIPLTNEILDKILPSGYQVISAPKGFVQSSQKPPDVIEAPEGYMLPEDNNLSHKALIDTFTTEVPGIKDLQFFRENDAIHFGKLLKVKNEDRLSSEELKEIRVLTLLLKIKNGSPASRKVAMRQLTDNATQFGPKPIFDPILAMLLEDKIDEQEKHLLVKVIDRVLFRLDDMIRPYTHRILFVVTPLLIEEDYYTRITGREIISNLAKAAGLAHMIATMKPDIDNAEEYVRNTTSRAFAVVASALGIPSLLPFLRAVCRSKKSWQARHTGVKIIQQIAILMGSGVLPYLNSLVGCIGKNLTDENQSVRMMTALALSALAEASAPYGIDSFNDILEPLWQGVNRHRGKSLAAHIKCWGYLITSMDEEYSNYYSTELMPIILREFDSPDEDMKKTVLKVVQQISVTDGVTPKFLRRDVIPTFFRYFWTRRMALDRVSKMIVETTVILSQKVGVAEIISRVLDILKDPSEPFRKMAVETVDRVVGLYGISDLTPREESRLIDGVLTAYQEQSTQDRVFLNGFSTVVNSLGIRAQTHMKAILSSILFRMNNQAAEVRVQAADLIGKIAPSLKLCGEEGQIGMVSSILYEQFGEPSPEVLGSVVGAMCAIVSVVGMDSVKPPIDQILMHVTPILRNRHPKVQENALQLVGKISDRGAEYVNAKELLRIAYGLIELLKSPTKSIRKSANSTFGLIAKAIGPADVLLALLRNLKVQERQLRVCTAIALGIVAETCSPFTVLPALMNEYRTPQKNVQNGILKAMAFMFEYIGSMAKDYVYAVTPLLEDALTDRDQVHRQTAATVVRHIALGCVGLGCEDAFIHFLNLLMPNVFETSPHVIDRILEGIDGCRNAVGVGIFMNYIWAGLFHPARKVRTPYWRMYNSAYVQSVDSMVPYFPEVDEEYESYRIEELDIVI